MAVWLNELKRPELRWEQKTHHTLFIYGVAFLILFLLGKGLFAVRPRRLRGTGFPFVYVEEDGTVREPNADERDYLNEQFEPTDGGRPYIKFNYESKTPDGNISGFLWRCHLPSNIPIRSNDDGLNPSSKEKR